MSYISYDNFGRSEFYIILSENEKQQNSFFTTGSSYSKTISEQLNQISTIQKLRKKTEKKQKHLQNSLILH